MRLILGLFFSVLVVGCQTTPTKVRESLDLDFAAMQSAAERPIQLTNKTVVVDVRKPFDYTLAHIPGSVNLNWEDFSDRNGRFKGRLKQDLNDEARRLALLGISPESDVVVVGYGAQGEGGEGRMAWTLASMGVRKVQFVDFAYFKKLPLSNKIEPPRKNVPFWEVKTSHPLSASKEELLSVITAAAEGGTRTRILDVRSEREYFAKQGLGMGYSQPDIQAVHIPWTEFLTNHGRPNLQLVDQLSGIGIKPSDRLILISNQGVRSATATMALLAMGFTNSVNFAGGYQELK